MSALVKVGGLTAPVDRRTYLGVGTALMVLKYGVDAGLLYALTGQLVSPLVYLVPSLALRVDLLAQAPSWLLLALVAWTLPFAWVGVSMSVRRARDAGLPGAIGLLFFLPLLNYLLIATLAVLPSRPGARPPALPLRGADRALSSALVGVGSGVLLGGGLTALTVYGAGEYGLALFYGTPFLMGAVAGLLHNLGQRRGLLATLGVGALTVGITGGTLLLFGVEGLICILMATPFALVLGLLGALVGRELAAVPTRRLAGPALLVPALGFVEGQAPAPPLREVLTTVEVDAPPEAVWPVVVAFPEIPSEDLPALFRAGLAWPQRARIEGEGVGAVRYCEFSTGAFVEPITAWEPPHRLAFDVIEDPSPLVELSPWGAIDAPHLDGFLRSRRGEFRLVALDGGRTRLEGRTWYEVDMAPGFYWGAWSDAIIHRIHQRVLGHIAGVVEAG